MSQQLILELGDKEYQAAEQAAQAAGKTISEWAAANLVQLLESEPLRRNFDSFSPEVQSAMRGIAALYGGIPEEYAARFWAQIAPRPRPQLTREEWESARQRLRRHAGAVNTDDPHSSDNDQIDADLVREYAGMTDAA